VSQLKTAGGRVPSAAEGSFADVGASERHIEKQNSQFTVNSRPFQNTSTSYYRAGTGGCFCI